MSNKTGASVSAEIIAKALNKLQKAKNAANTQQTEKHDIKYISDAISAIKIVQEETSLQTPGVGGLLPKITEIAAEFMDSLFSDDEQTKSTALRAAKEKLKTENSNLLLKIRTVFVGLSGPDDSHSLDVKLVKKVNDRLVNKFGSEGKLVVAQLLDGLPKARNNDTIQLSEEEIERFNQLCSDLDPTPTGRILPGTKRIVLDNITKDQAFQINGPIGEKGWIEFAELEIRGNRAENNAVQVNHAIGSDTFSILLRERRQDIREGIWEAIKFRTT